MVKTQKDIQCQNEACLNFLKIWTIHCEEYTQPLHGHHHGPVETYSIQTGYGQTHVRAVIHVGLHTWPVVYCDECGCMPVEIDVVSETVEMKETNEHG